MQHGKTKRSKADDEAAKHLLAHESANDGPAAAAARVYERLSDRLAPLIGTAGFEALVSRSVKLTKNELPCLEDFVVTSELSEKDSARPGKRLLVCLSNVEPEAIEAASVALYSTLLGLLKVFIGGQLVRQVLRGAFPALDKNVGEETER